MKFKSPEDFQYLSGEKFSNGRAFSFAYSADDFHYQSRNDILKKMVAGKRIIHLGCVDVTETIQHRIDRGKWLHKEMHEVARRCLGVDINAEGIGFIRDKLSYSDVMVADVTKPPAGDLAECDWDYFMIPEVLEHVNNPVDFLGKIRHNYQANVGQVVITVPNALTPDNYRYARKGMEVINTDHRYWFTPYTLAKVVHNAGFSINNIIMCRHGKVKKRSFLKNLKFSRHPLIRSDIIMVLDFSG